MSGRELRRLRLRSGLTLKQAGKLLRMSFTTVWRKEAGKSDISYAEGVGIRVLFERHTRKH